MNETVKEQIEIIDRYIERIEKAKYESAKGWQVPYHEMLKHWTVLKDKLKQLDNERTKGHGHD